MSDAFIFFFFFFFFLFRAAPAAYGSSPARGHIGAVAASLSHSRGNASLQQHWILNSLSKARDGIKPIFSETLCQVLNPLSHNGNSWYFFFFLRRKNEILEQTSFLTISPNLMWTNNLNYCMFWFLKKNDSVIFSSRNSNICIDRAIPASY